MLNKQLRKDFMRAVSKATLILMMPVALALPVQSAEAQPFVPDIKQSQFLDTISASAPTKPQDFFDLQIKEGSVEIVSFEKPVPRDVLVKHYPFLKEVMSDVSALEEGQNIPPTDIMVSRIRDPETNTNLLFVYMSGFMTCGSLGCQINVYADRGKGYEGVMGIIANEFTIAKQEGKISLFFCGNEGRGEWVLGEKFTHKENVQKPTSGPTCN